MRVCLQTRIVIASISHDMGKAAMVGSVEKGDNCRQSWQWVDKAGDGSRRRRRGVGKDGRV